MRSAGNESNKLIINFLVRLSSTLLYTLMWAEPTLELQCSRRGNQGMYIMSVTPYIPGVDRAKISLAGACEFFCN